MLSVLIRDEHGIEMIHGNVRDVMMVPEEGKITAARPHEPGVHVRFYSGDGLYLPWRKCASSTDRKDAGVYVMNETGKTVAKYQL